MNSSLGSRKIKKQSLRLQGALILLCSLRLCFLIFRDPREEFIRSIHTVSNFEKFRSRSRSQTRPHVTRLKRCVGFAGFLHIIQIISIMDSCSAPIYHQLLLLSSLWQLIALQPLHRLNSKLTVLFVLIHSLCEQKIGFSLHLY